MPNERFTIADLLKRGYAPDGKGGYVRVRNVIHTSSIQEQKNIEAPVEREKKTNNRPKDPKNYERDGYLFPIYSPVELQITVVQKDKKRRDLDGCVSTILDCLVKAGILEDDRLQIVSSIKVKYEPGKKDQTKIRILNYIPSTDF